MNPNLIAKAIAAFLMPIIAALLAWLLEATGINVPFDPSWVETVVLSVVTSVAVWWKPNSDKPIRFFGRVWY